MKAGITSQTLARRFQKDDNLTAKEYFSLCKVLNLNPNKFWYNKSEYDADVVEPEAKYYKETELDYKHHCELLERENEFLKEQLASKKELLKSKDDQIRLLNK